MNNIINAGQQAAPQESMRLENALNALESQQEVIYRQAIEIGYKLTGDEPVEEKGMEAYGYEKRLQRLMWKNDEIIDKMLRFIERF